MPIDVSIMIEGQNGLNWDRWKKMVEASERLGFAGLYRSDHFTNSNPPDQDSLELWVSLTYLADNTDRLRFGPLVCPFSFRHPAMIARQGAALHDLSGGRFVLGVGAGWQEREHSLFGYHLGDMKTRMNRFEEGLEVVTRLLKGNGPVSFEGEFYQLREAELLPKAGSVGRPPIMVGAKGRTRTVPLAAKYADIWNGSFLSPTVCRAMNDLLDERAESYGRAPSEIRRTLMSGLRYAPDERALESVLEPLRNRDEFAGKSLEELVQALVDRGLVVGTPEVIVNQLEDFEKAGVEEIMLQWLDLDDLDGLEALAGATLD